MVTLRFTRRLLDFMGFDPIPEPESPTAALGDWYANIIETTRGELAVFVNERTLLSIAVEQKQFGEIIPTFVQRLHNLLCVLQLPQSEIQREMQEIGDIQVALVKNQRVTGFLNQIAGEYRKSISELAPERAMNIAAIELTLSDEEMKALGNQRPVMVARELLSGGEIGALH